MAAAGTSNKNLKQNTQIQYTDGVQAFFCVIYDIVRSYISTVKLLVGEAPGPRPPAPNVSAETPATQQAAL